MPNILMPPSVTRRILAFLQITGLRSILSDSLFVGARMPCFYYALAAYNGWMVLQMLHSDGFERQYELVQMVSKSGMETVLIREPKPPHDIGLVPTFHLTDSENF